MKLAFILTSLLISGFASAEQLTTYNGTTYSCPDNTFFRILNGQTLCVPQAQNTMPAPIDTLQSNNQGLNDSSMDSGNVSININGQQSSYSCDGELIVVGNSATCNGAPLASQ